MNIAVDKGFLRGEIEIISSKSVAHRVMICAAAANEQTVIKGLNNSADVFATINCLTALGAEFQKDGDGVYKVTPIGDIKSRDDLKTLNCGESGSTLRFLLPFAASLGVKAEFNTEGRLPERPIEELIAVMEKNGASVIKKGAKIYVSGELKSGDYRISAKVSSQFISGLLMALSRVKGGGRIILDGEAESEGYINITVDVMEKFGAKTHYDKGVYEVKGRGSYISSGIAEIEGDWSNAAFFIAAGILNGDIVLKGLNINSKQPDREIIDIIRRMGGKIEERKDGIEVKKSCLHGTEIDVKNIPDLAPVLSVVAGLANGRTIMRNVERLRLKECDRLSAVAETITKSGGRAVMEDSRLIIDGVKEYKSAVLSGFNDHRMVMSAAILALGASGTITINGTEAVNKSYPDFFEEYKRLGGKICHL
ncbi:MAG: 3-phosphoshikimate 1-carboxyvinyltransferase [Clostridiales bacterium]|jgi:3-phosphoshikimate 1-carboxyvinyltransferase|nr:3-phosphoshikimate 1-carboxyvinyltransferase [Clostridiales bacterium]